MERNLIRQRITEGIAAARAHGHKGGRPRVITSDKLRYAQHLMAAQSRSIPAICRELVDLPASTLYDYLHANGSLKVPGRELVGTDGRAGGAPLVGGAPGDEALSEPRRPHAVV